MTPSPPAQRRRYYYYHNEGLQPQYVLYGQDSLAAAPVCLLDPNTLSEDGTVALKDATFSDDGTLMAYSLSSGGSDWATIKVGQGGVRAPAVGEREGGGGGKLATTGSCQARPSSRHQRGLRLGVCQGRGGWGA